MRNTRIPCLLPSAQWSLSFWLMILFAYTSAAQVWPAPPNTASVVTCFPDTVGYKRITVGPIDRDYSDLQLAINAAPMGSVIVLDAGATFIGGFTLPYKGEGEDWIILMSSRMDLLSPEESRISPSSPTGDPEFPTQRDAMPKIITNNTSGLIPCIKTLTYAHHYRLVGLEASLDSAIVQSTGLLTLGDGSTAQNSLAKVPYNLIVDRCYVHGLTLPGVIVMKYGVRLDCANSAVIDSYISEFHTIGFDAQAISCVNGPGPFKIINNYLEGAGENILIGGGAPAIVGLVPSDIEIRQNYFYKPWSWRVGHPDYAGTHWTIKNLFELKTGIRVLLDGNILENSWADLPDGQSGYAILLTVRNENGNAPQAAIGDVMISNNIIRHVGAGITITGMDDTPSNQTQYITVYNNLFEDISGPDYGDQNTAGPNDGTFVKIGDPISVEFDHNTIFQTGPVTWAYDTMYGFAYTNNISRSAVSAGGYQGIYGPGQSQGNNTIATYFPDITDAGMQFNKNVLIGGDASKYTNYNTLSQNDFPATTNDVLFVDYDNGAVDYHDYALLSSSPYAKAGTDGADLGVDFAMLDAALMTRINCDSTSSIGGFGANLDDLLKIYPNPVYDHLTVEHDLDARVLCHVRDMTGRLLLVTEETTKRFEVDLENWSSGVYVLTLTSSRGSASRIFAVQR